MSGCGSMGQDSWCLGAVVVTSTRPLGARFGGIVVTSAENVDFWYRYVGIVATGNESVDSGYPNMDILVSLASPKYS